MCGRFTVTFEFSDIRVRWNLDSDLPKYTPRFNVAPETSPNIPVIVRHKGSNECRLMHWGLIPHWAADPSIGNRMINAGAETLTELPSLTRRKSEQFFHRARHTYSTPVPKCNGYLGIVVPERKAKPVQAINGRCLKCGYRLAWVLVCGNVSLANLLNYRSF